MGIPNYFAYFALFAWPLVCVAFFLRLNAEKATIFSLFGAYFLLPSNFAVQVPGFPPLDKTSISALTTFVLLLFKSQKKDGRKPSVAVYILAAVFVLSPILTSFDNSYELQTGAVSIPGFYPIDGVKYVWRQLILVLPLFIGLRALSSDYGRRLLLVTIPIAILLYSPLMLIEIRLSPQFHRWVYGYIPSDFSQSVRAGGFRPVVFLTHGIEVALITCVALVSAFVLAKGRIRFTRFPTAIVTSYLAILLLLCKTLGTVIYALTILPVVWFFKPKTWIKFTLGVLLIVLVYPGLRSAHMIPLDAVKRVSESVSVDRTESFQMRVTNEEQLLAKANEKPLFGWGTWGRNRLFDSWTGKSISVTDGGWIILFGVWGWVGYLSTFGIFTVCVFGALRTVGRSDDRVAIVLGGLALTLTMYILNMLPNTTNMMLPLLLAGALAPYERPSRMRAKVPSNGIAAVGVG